MYAWFAVRLAASAAERAEFSKNKRQSETGQGRILKPTTTFPVKSYSKFLQENPMRRPP